MNAVATARRLEHLGRANETRLARAELKRQLKRREVSARDVIADPPKCVLTMAVFDLLRAQYRWGGIKAKRFLRSCQLSEGRPVGALTERQRDMLVWRLR